RAETRAVRPLNFDSEHCQAQLAAARHLGQGGRVSLAIGAAGSGKTTLAQPLVDAWKSRGFQVHGIAVAWRQASDLEDAGISGTVAVKPAA
ncbi:AAA family ATPase, partial [Pseudomonas juntendi]|uniref:AAA family ATPase n=1 Tax=Pseudomonas juntendi TaxID=2666183 RepID=UPI00211946ED